MFGDLMGNMEQQQEEIQKRLAQITLNAEAGNGAIKVTANGNRQILNVSIDKEKLDWDDIEQVEDLIMVAINRVIEKVTEQEAIESQKALKDMLPPGMGNLFG